MLSNTVMAITSRMIGQVGIWNMWKKTEMHRKLR
jgi:hypothetical protein